MVEPSATGVAGDAPARIVVGLGNPGDAYAGTRHNLGFEVVAELARRRRIALARPDCHSRLGWDDELVLALPQTYMNRSGHAVRCLGERFGFAPDSILVVYDEIHLPLGRLRLRRGGSPAGHRGLESVIESLGTDEVPRLRLGVASEDGAPAAEALVDFVLAPFTAEERPVADAMVERAAAACETWARDGVEAAMQSFNR